MNFVPCGEAVLIGRFCILDCVVGQKHCPLYRGCPLVFTKQLLVEVDYVSFVSCVTFALIRYGQLLSRACSVQPRRTHDVTLPTCNLATDGGGESPCPD